MSPSFVNDFCRMMTEAPSRITLNESNQDKSCCVSTSVLKTEYRRNSNDGDNREPVYALPNKSFNF